MPEALKRRRPGAALAIVATLALSGTALATHVPVPASEAGRFAPEQLRGLLSGPVQVTERMAGRSRGALLVRRFGEDGRWTGCAIGSKGKASLQTGRWSVAADSRGRGKLFAHSHHRPKHRHHVNPSVIHYETGTGHFLWRLWPVGPASPRQDRGWVDWNRGWLQATWPRIAVDKCPDLDLGGAGVDKRQTASTLASLRRQTPDAPLKGLAEPLPVLRDAQ